MGRTIKVLPWFRKKATLKKKEALTEAKKRRNARKLRGFGGIFRKVRKGL